jgi:hypothetical protein
MHALLHIDPNHIAVVYMKWRVLNMSNSCA